MTLPQVLTDAFASGEVRQADGTTVALFSNVHLEEAQRLYDLVRARRPVASVEIGLAQGMSALAIAQAMLDNGDGGRHHVIDPFQHEHWRDTGVANLERAGLAEVADVHDAYPEAVVPSLPRVGFGFIDGSHLFDLSIVDFVLLDKRLEVGGLLGFHDLVMPSLQKTLRYIVTNRHYTPFDDQGPTVVPTRADRARSRVKRVARRIPGAERVFRPELLEPTFDLGLRGNMVFVEKRGEDDRHWQSHHAF